MLLPQYFDADTFFWIEYRNKKMYAYRYDLLSPLDSMLLGELTLRTNIPHAINLL